MEIQKLLEIYARHPLTQRFAHVIQDGKFRHIRLSGLQGSSSALFFAALATRSPQLLGAPLLFILPDEEEAAYFYQDLTQLLGDEYVLLFPSSFKRAVKYGQRDSANIILRTQALSRLLSPGRPLFLVASPQAMAERVEDSTQLKRHTLEISLHQHLDIMQVQQTLLELGFQRTDYVYEPGQFSLRGSLLDVYSYSCEYPYRIDFFGDEVDSIRLFDVQDQLSVSRLTQASIIPSSAAGEGDSALQSFLSFLPSDTLLVGCDTAYVADLVGQIWDEGFTSQAIVSQQAEGYPADTLDALPGKAADASRTDLSTPDTAGMLAGLPLEKRTLLVSPNEFRQQLQAFRSVTLGPHTVSSAESATEETLMLEAHTLAQPVFHKNFDLIFRCFQDYIGQGYTLYVLSDAESQTKRLEAIFSDRQSDLRFTPIDHTLHAGFIDSDLRICCFTDHQIFDRFHRYTLRSDRTRNGKLALTLKELQQFQIGDYVVHIDHGIGRFGGLVRIPNGGTWQEVIKIIYKNDDVVFVSIHALHKVSKYRAKEGEPPRLSALGTGAWERMKQRTKSHIKDIARDLIRLYSQRQHEKGFAFSPDGYLQHELEASFLYEDTPDQQKATREVKADMQKAQPMDRLICGDVGFGKTEIAVRAAFKACADGKQVALLVPTTILAYQHFHTFSTRLKDMPVRVEYLSRARSAAQTKTILEDLRQGRIDILIGTQKLLGKTVRFKDLGLLIVDEEQKFGVSTKEKLRQMKTNVDTLTLTATPIPRTLQFSLMGARDLSVIQTPPPNRRPIQMMLCTFSAQIITQAIEFEMSRGGQVLFVTPRISQIPDLQALILRCVPDARVAVGHGRMPSEELEQVMLSFANYDYDVLLSTTIVESGLDIPNANTIIINGAQCFGLSDLHQMRGRVGRASRKAFCYLMAPPLALLPQDARRRLQAIENFSALGSGIQIAMQDLDIRGAGNLLGAEQSGFIADLGYEAYQKILSQAVSELKREEFQTQTEQQQETSAEDCVLQPDECIVESDLPMSFSEAYVPTSAERMLLYRELDSLQTDAQVNDFRRRLQDRFGPIPSEADELIRVVSLRSLACQFGAERIVLKKARMRLFFVSNEHTTFFQSQAFGQIIAFATTNIHLCRLQEENGHRSLLLTDVPSVKAALDILHQISLCTSPDASASSSSSAN